MLQDKLQQRFYTTTMVFARDLCHAVHEGINTEPTIPDTGNVDASPSKHASISFETKDRKRLGKRILKSVQKLLQAALQAEADITNKSVDVQPLMDDLESMIDASLEVRQPPVPVINEEEVAEDMLMPDAQGDESNLLSHSQQNTYEVQHPEDDAVHTAGGEAEVKAEDGEVADDDAMDIDSVGPITECTNGLQPSADDAEQLGEIAAAMGNAEQATTVTINKPDHSRLQNGITQASSPPHSANANSPPIAPVQAQSQPLTPPRSTTNGIVPTDILNNGGIPWYLSDMHLEGTTVGEEPSLEDGDDEDLSEEEEELSEMDDDTLNDLGVHVNNSETPAAPTAPAAARKGRANPANFRKGTRSSARARR